MMRLYEDNTEINEKLKCEYKSSICGILRYFLTYSFSINSYNLELFHSCPIFLVLSAMLLIKSVDYHLIPKSVSIR